MDDRTKTILLIVFVVIALAIAVFSGYRFFRQEQGEVQGHIDLFPGGKQGEIQRQNQTAPPITPSQSSP
ncbi:MAG: hypothetical protein KatS3mg019_1931 [Fimbriimonadales bacterium]|nr:MAG: hypothetical protein KatS3mg019_1931 [Fimbriimonadales bacterium]